MSTGATLIASLLAVLDRPSTWILGLLGFLVRGGWLLVVAPIVVLPTAAGLANVVAPLLEDVAFGRRTGELIGLIVLVLIAVAVWLVGGGLIAAAAEAEAVRRIAEIDSAAVDLSRNDLPSRAWRIVALRLAAHLPFAIALVWGLFRIVAVGYRELTVPSDVLSPAPVRIATGAADAILGIVITWLVGETIGAMGARRVVLAGEGARTALRAAIGRFVQAPVRPVALAIVSGLVLAGVVAVTGLAAGAAWDALRSALMIGDISAGSAAPLVVFVGLFTGGLVLVALTTAWRAAIWTLEAHGTFGGGDRTRSGD